MFNSLTHKDKIVVLHETFNNTSAIQSNDSTKSKYNL